MPLEKVAPMKIPILATIIMVFLVATLEPIAEFKKFTASLLTPTTRSAVARKRSRITMKRYNSVRLKF
jgi:hypothetical protein